MVTSNNTASARIVEKLMVGLCRFVTGIHPRWLCPQDSPVPRIYYANHTSHLDGLVIWSGLPPRLRNCTFLVAGKDYWNTSALKRYLAGRIFKTVLVDRKSAPGFNRDTLTPLAEQIDRGNSLIIFPEGTRGVGESIAPFKSGLYHLAQRFPDVELVPVYLQNLNRVLPKGSFLMVPVICSATFGPPLDQGAEETNKREFLDMARQSLANLAP